VQPALLDALRAAPPIPGLTDARFTPAPRTAGVPPAGKTISPAASSPAPSSATPKATLPPPTRTCARPGASPNAAPWSCTWPTSP
jgi:hypothetical protein